MKRKLKVTILVLAMILGVIGTSTETFASEKFQTVGASSSWTTIATASEGFGCNVKITGLLTSIARIDVQMLGRRGNVLWSQNDSCPGSNSRVYSCGSDVYTIQVRVNPWVQGTIMARKTSEPAD